MNEDGRSSIFYINDFGIIGQIYQLTPGIVTESSFTQSCNVCMSVSGDMTSWSPPAYLDINTCNKANRIDVTLDGTGCINLFYVNPIDSCRWHYQSVLLFVNNLLPFTMTDIYTGKQIEPNAGWTACGSTGFMGSEIAAITNQDGRVEVGTYVHQNCRIVTYELTRMIGFLSLPIDPLSLLRELSRCCGLVHSGAHRR